MKIAFIHNKYATYGGAERYIDNLTKGLLARGDEVHIYAARFKSELPSKAVPHKVFFIRLGRIAKEISFAISTAKIKEKNKYDIVQGFSRTFSQDVIRTGGGVHKVYMQESLGALSPLSRAIKLFMRTISPAHIVSRYVESVGFKEKNHRFVIAVSNKIKKDILGEYSLSPERVRVIHNGFNPQSFYPASDDRERLKIRNQYSVSEDDTLMLLVATNFPLKGLPVILKSMAQLKKPNLKLLILGGGNRKPFQKMANELGVSNQVIFAGKQTPLPYYHAADFLVHPTLYDPFANVCLEAMASGLPVVTSRVNGFSDIVEDKKEVLILNDPTNAEELAGAIEYMLDKEVRSEMSRCGLELSKDYTIEKHLDKVLNLYQEVVEEKGRA